MPPVIGRVFPHLTPPAVRGVEAGPSRLAPSTEGPTLQSAGQSKRQDAFVPEPEPEPEPEPPRRLTI
jgi:hypothetical protein